VVVTYCLLPYVNEMFGEREHIFTCMILPWLFSSISDREVRSKKEQIVDGIMAGIGIAMKPFFIAAFCVVQLVNLTSSRRRAQLCAAQPGASGGGGMTAARSSRPREARARLKAA